MEKRNPANEAAGVDPVALALWGVLAISAWCAWRVIAAAVAVREAAQEKEAYVILLTDEGLKSDNESLAAKVNETQAALLDAEREGWMLLAICAMLAGSLVWRSFTSSRMPNSPIERTSPTEGCCSPRSVSRWACSTCRT